MPPVTQRRWQLDWAYCLTVHRTIGEGFNDVTVWDLERMTPRVLYTAICRAHSIDRLELRGTPSH